MTVAVAGLALAAAGTVFQFVQQRKAGKAAKKSAEQAKLQQEFEAKRARRRAIREQRIARAQVLNTGSQTGGTGSSGLAGGISSVASQGGANLQAAEAGNTFSERTYRANLDYAKFSSRAQIGGAVAGLGGSLFNAGGGFGALGIDENTRLFGGGGGSAGPLAGRL